MRKHRGRRNEHNQGKTDGNDPENFQQRFGKQPGKQESKELNEEGQRQKKADIFQTNQPVPVNVNKMSDQIVIGRHVSEYNHLAKQAEIQRRLTLLSEEEKNQVIEGHQRNAAYQKKVSADCSEPGFLDVFCSSQVYQVPYPPDLWQKLLTCTRMVKEAC